MTLQTGGYLDAERRAADPPHADSADWPLGAWIFRLAQPRFWRGSSSHALRRARVGAQGKQCSGAPGEVMGEWRRPRRPRFSRELRNAREALADNGSKLAVRVSTCHQLSGVNAREQCRELDPRREWFVFTSGLTSVVGGGGIGRPRPRLSSRCQVELEAIERSLGQPAGPLRGNASVNVQGDGSCTSRLALPGVSPGQPAFTFRRFSTHCTPPISSGVSQQIVERWAILGKPLASVSRSTLSTPEIVDGYRPPV